MLYSNGINLGLRRPRPEDMLFGERKNFIIGEIKHGKPHLDFLF
jgi:hypothetical protein